MVCSLVITFTESDTMTYCHNFYCEEPNPCNAVYLRLYINHIPDGRTTHDVSKDLMSRILSTCVNKGNEGEGRRARRGLRRVGAGVGMEEVVLGEVRKKGLLF